jgi:hypothetical protein
LEAQKTANSQGNIEQKQQHWGIIDDFKLIYRAIAIKAAVTGTKIDMKTSGIE